MQTQSSGKAILYAAKSTPDEGGSIEEQLRDGREKAEADGLEVVAEYSEENVSAYKGDRGPELARAIEHAARIGAVLIVQHSDRLARGDVVQAQHLVEIAVKAMHEGFTLCSVEDPTTFGSLSASATQGDRNHEDSRLKGNRVRKGHRRSRAKGYIGGSRSLGYELLRKVQTGSKTARESKIIPAEAVIVGRIYDECFAGHSQLGIARDLAADKVPTAEGGKWHQSTIRRILRNPIYAGLIRQGGRAGTELIEGTHKPIVERQRWEDVQALLDAKASTCPRGREPAGQHLFRRGHLRCGECEGAMVPRTERGREVYRCYNRMRDSGSCSMPPISRAEVDDAVWCYFAEIALDVEATRRQLAEATNRKLAEAVALRDGAAREAATATENLNRMSGYFTEGRITPEDWYERRDLLEGDLEAANAQAERLAAQVEGVEGETDIGDAEAGVLHYLTMIRQAVKGQITDAGGTDAVRAALTRMFDAFFLYKGKPREGDVEGEVLLPSERWIEPLPSQHAIAGYDEKLRPVLARKPLEKAANLYAPESTGS